MLSYGITAVLLGTILYFGWKFTARSAYESARYSVITSEENFEVRDYADLVLVSTPMRFDARGNDGSFSRLFRYISGDNGEQQKVAMTTPVFMQRGAETTTDGSITSQQGEMSFVVPERVAADGAPQPGNAVVQLRNREGGRFAALRFAGRMEDASLNEREAQLRHWMKQQNLVATGPVEFAGYDPPWTPGFLRRNEILIRVD
jgi:hypothetical protein